MKSAKKSMRLMKANATQYASLHRCGGVVGCMGQGVCGDGWSIGIRVLVSIYIASA